MNVFQKIYSVVLILLLIGCINKDKVVNRILTANPTLVDSIKMRDERSKRVYLIRDRKFIHDFVRGLNDLEPLQSINHPRTERSFECILHTKNGEVCFVLTSTLDQGTFITTYSNGFRGLFLGYYRNDSLRRLMYQVDAFE